MKKGGRLVAYAGLGCGTLLVGICLVLGWVAYRVGEAPAAVEDPNFWFQAPGERFLTAWADCAREWDEGGLNGPRRCEELVRSPSVLPGPAAVWVWYEVEQNSRLVDAVELHYEELPYTLEEAEDQIRSGLSEVIDWGACEPAYVPFALVRKWHCGQRTYAYLVSLGERGQVAATIWVSQLGARLNDGMLERTASIHRGFAEDSLSKGRAAVGEEELALADWYLLQAYFLLTQIHPWKRTSSDEELIAESLELRRGLAPGVYEDRRANRIGAPLPSYGEVIHLRSLFERSPTELESYFVNVDRTCTQSLTGGPTHCTFTGNSWVLEAESHSQSSERVALRLHIDVPPEDSILGMFELPYRRPDSHGPSEEEEGMEVMRWDDIGGLRAVEVEFSREEGVLVVEAFAMEAN